MKIFKIILTLVAVTLTPQRGWSQPLSSLRTNQNIEKGLKLGETYVDFYFLGFNHQNKALFIVDLVGKGLVYWVDPTTGKIVKKQYQGHFDPAAAYLTPSGKNILAEPTAWDPGINHPNLMIFDSSDTKKFKKLQIGNSHTNVYAPHPFDNDKAAIGVLESTWDSELKDYAGDYKKGAHYEIWDWKKGHKITTIKKESVGATRLFFGARQNQRWMVSFFKYQKDYDYAAAFRPKGALSFFDTKTGDTNWRIYGDAYQTVGFPIAQLSPTQIVSQSTIFEYPAKCIRPLRMQGEHVRLLGIVPGQPQKMIVATKRGAELWDYTKQKCLHRWPEIKDINQILFSPDLHFFATQKYAEHLYEFYRFDKK